MIVGLLFSWYLLVITAPAEVPVMVGPYETQKDCERIRRHMATIGYRVSDDCFDLSPKGS